MEQTNILKPIVKLASYKQAKNNIKGACFI
jgi:hypothetical protein